MKRMCLWIPLRWQPEEDAITRMWLLLRLFHSRNPTPRFLSSIYLKSSCAVPEMISLYSFIACFSHSLISTTALSPNQYPTHKRGTPADPRRRGSSSRDSTLGLPLRYPSKHTSQDSQSSTTSPRQRCSRPFTTLISSRIIISHTLP